MAVFNSFLYVYERVPLIPPVHHKFPHSNYGKSPFLISQIDGSRHVWCLTTILLTAPRGSPPVLSAKDVQPAVSSPQSTRPDHSKVAPDLPLASQMGKKNMGLKGVTWYIWINYIFICIKNTYKYTIYIYICINNIHIYIYISGYIIIFH